MLCTLDFSLIHCNIVVSHWCLHCCMEGINMEAKKKEEKKVWVKPQLVVYGEIDKLTKELPLIPYGKTGSGYR